MKYMTCAVCVCSLLLTGCFGASNNPHEGGMFGFSPETYQQRQQEQKVRLSSLQEENERLHTEEADLNRNRATASREVADLQVQQKRLRNEKATLEKALAQINAANAADEKKLASLRTQSKDVSRSMDAKSAAGATSIKRQIAR